MQILEWDLESALPISSPRMLSLIANENYCTLLHYHQKLSEFIAIAECLGDSVAKSIRYIQTDEFKLTSLVALN